MVSAESFSNNVEVQSRTECHGMIWWRLCGCFSSPIFSSDHMVPFSFFMFCVFLTLFILSSFTGSPLDGGTPSWLWIDAFSFFPFFLDAVGKGTIDLRQFATVETSSLCFRISLSLCISPSGFCFALFCLMTWRGNKCMAQWQAPYFLFRAFKRPIWSLSNSHLMWFCLIF